MDTKTLSFEEIQIDKKYYSFRTAVDAVIFFVKEITDHEIIVHWINIWHNEIDFGINIKPNFVIEKKRWVFGHLFGSKIYVYEGREHRNIIFNLLFREL